VGVLLKIGFTRSTADPSLFLKRDEDNAWILVYVDNLLNPGQMRNSEQIQGNTEG